MHRAPLRLERGAGTEVHDAAAVALLDQVPTDRLGQEEGCTQVDRLHEVPRLDVEVEQPGASLLGIDGTDAGRVHEDVDPPEARSHVVDRRRDDVGVGEVDLDERALSRRAPATPLRPSHQFARFWSNTTTDAPCSANSSAVARPIPDAPPVTIATFPARSCSVTEDPPRSPDSTVVHTREGVGEPARGSGSARPPPEQVLTVDEHDRRDGFELAAVPLLERVGLARRDDHVGAARDGVVEDQLGVAGVGVAEDVVDAQVGEHRRAVATAADGHPGSAPDRDERPAPDSALGAGADRAAPVRRRLRLPGAEAHRARRRPHRCPPRGPAGPPRTVARRPRVGSPRCTSPRRRERDA